MSTPLKSFLTKVATNPETLNSFKTDPEGTLKQAGLPDEQVNAVLTGDPTEIGKHVGAIAAGDTIIILIL
jgi:hypothetical protein